MDGFGIPFIDLNIIKRHHDMEVMIFWEDSARALACSWRLLNSLLSEVRKLLKTRRATKRPVSHVEKETFHNLPM
jgi:hypothetical protein